MFNMRDRFERFSRNNVLLSVVMVILGLLLILWPGKTLELAAKILGVALLVGAVKAAVAVIVSIILYNGISNRLIEMKCRKAGR